MSEKCSGKVRRGSVDLSVVSVKMILEVKGADELTQGGHIEGEEERSKNRTLGDTHT